MAHASQKGHCPKRWHASGFRGLRAGELRLADRSRLGPRVEEVVAQVVLGARDGLALEVLLGRGLDVGADPLGVLLGRLVAGLEHVALGRVCRLAPLLAVGRPHPLAVRSDDDLHAVLVQDRDLLRALPRPEQHVVEAALDLEAERLRPHVVVGHLPVHREPAPVRGRAVLDRVGGRLVLDQEHAARRALAYDGVDLAGQEVGTRRGTRPRVHERRGERGLDGQDLVRLHLDGPLRVVAPQELLDGGLLVEILRAARDAHDRLVQTLPRLGQPPALEPLVREAPERERRVLAVRPPAVEVDEPVAALAVAPRTESAVSE